MLVMANGAFKSGSTWLRNVVQRMIDFEPIPPEYQHPEYSHWVNPRKIRAMLRQADCAENNYISKSHLFGRRYVKLLISDRHVRVLNMERDLRDSLVSHFYHMVREGKVKQDFARYFWSIGRYKAYQLLLYRAAWKVDSPRVYVSSFERLKANFVGEVRNVADFLGADVSDERIAEIQDETSIEKMRKSRGEEGKDETQRFYRKGIVGDWRNHFDVDMIADLDRICDEGLRPLERTKYHLLFTGRQAVKRFFGYRSRMMFRLLRRI